MAHRQALKISGKLAKRRILLSKEIFEKVNIRKTSNIKKKKNE